MGTTFTISFTIYRMKFTTIFVAAALAVNPDLRLSSDESTSPAPRLATTSSRQPLPPGLACNDLGSCEACVGYEECVYCGSSLVPDMWEPGCMEKNFGSEFCEGFTNAFNVAECNGQALLAVTLASAVAVALLV